VVDGFTSTAERKIEIMLVLLCVARASQTRGDRTSVRQQHQHGIRTIGYAMWFTICLYGIHYMPPERLKISNHRPCQTVEDTTTMEEGVTGITLHHGHAGGPTVGLYAVEHYVICPSYSS
jgi:hypothetical protein